MEIREATREDKKAIARLCNRSVRHDYVPLFLDTYLREGGLFIAEDGGKIIGMTKLTFCPGGDAWLGAGRTDPAYRRRGIGRAVVEECCRAAESRGARSARLWSNRSNKAALAAVRSMGFTEVGSFVRVMKRVRRSPAKSSLRRERDVKRILTRLHRSSLLEESRGYAGAGNRFVKMNAEVVTELAKAGRIFRSDNGVVWIEDKAWGKAWTGVMEFSLLAGDTAMMLREVELYTRWRGYTELHAYFPAGSQSFRTARKSHFKTVKWGSDVVLFEKALRRTRRTR